MSHEPPLCDAPVPDGCQHYARAVILARSGENMIGNGMAVWSAYFRCDSDHKAARDAARISEVDPDSCVFVFTAPDGCVLVPGSYAAKIP